MQHRKDRELVIALRWRRLAALMFIIAVAALGATAYFFLRPRPKPPVVVEATQVQSEVVLEGDSLAVIVRWQLSAPPDIRPDSFRVEVRSDNAGEAATRVRMHPDARRQDTLYVPAPLAGITTEGASCVTTEQRAAPSRESCTLWQFVRPAAGPGHGPEPLRIVVQPVGLQVDPDIEGRCATWQKRHPTVSVWLEVNRVAVPACTGPNNRPTVAQFCAFAELADGERVKTANSANSRYCERLFRAWARERVS